MALFVSAAAFFYPTRLALGRVRRSIPGVNSTSARRTSKPTRKSGIDWQTLFASGPEQTALGTEKPPPVSQRWSTRCSTTQPVAEPIFATVVVPVVTPIVTPIVAMLTRRLRSAFPRPVLHPRHATVPPVRLRCHREGRDLVCAWPWQRGQYPPGSDVRR